MTSSAAPIPGSILLLDHTGASASEHLQGASDVVLSPEPSNDVNDPLRWSWKRKQITHACLVLYVLTVGISGTALYSVLVPIEAATGIPLATLNAGTGYMFLLLGWGGLITQPLALTFGKRGVYLVSQAATIGTVIWMAYIDSSSAWLANKVIQGLFASPIEMLIEDSIGDLFYAHERGFYIGIYAFMLFGSNYIAPLIAGFINDSLGYKWVFYICAMIQACGLIVSFFFLEETNYNRRKSSKSTIKPVTATQDDLMEKSDIVGPTHVVAADESDAQQLTGTPRTYMQRLAFFDKQFHPLSHLLVMIYRPLLLLRFPVIFWSGFLYGSALVWYNVLNATTSLLFSAPPYNFRSSSVGLTYIGPLIGVFCSGIYSGWLADKYMLRVSSQKGGIREPEDRLWMLSITVLLCPASLILWGVGASAGIHWVGLVFGGGILAFCSAVGAGFTINYALDTYKELSGEVLISIMLVRNTLSFAIGYGINPWIDAMTLRWCFVTAAMVGMVINASVFIVIRYGKAWRTASAERYWKYTETSVMSH